MAWTTWELNSTIAVQGASTAILETPQNVNSTITVALYVNGTLAANETYTAAPIITPPGSKVNSSAIVTETFYVLMNSNKGLNNGPATIPAGSVVSLVFLSATPVKLWFTSGPEVTTDEVTVSSGSSLPTTLPSSTSSSSDTMEMSAFVGE